MRSEVIGDFHEPYGAIVGEFDKVVLYSSGFCLIFTFSEAVKLYGRFSYNLAKALQALRNLPFPRGG